MRTACFALLLAAVLAACSSGGTPDGTTPSPDASGTAQPGDDSGSPSDAARGDDARTPDDGAVSADAPPPRDAGADASGPPVPHPPPGAKKCGSGTFSASDEVTACNTPGGLMAYQRQCNDLSTNGGAYEVWCSAGGVYLWARFDGVKIANPSTCTVTFDGSVFTLQPAMYMDISEFDVSGGAARESGSAKQVGDTFVDPSALGPATVAIEATSSSSITSANGTATMWLVTRQSGCPGDPDGPPIIRGGVALKWP